MTAKEEDPDFVRIYKDFMVEMKMAPHVVNQIWPSFFYFVTGRHEAHKQPVATFEEAEALMAAWEKQHGNSEGVLEEALKELEFEKRFFPHKR